MKDCREVGTEYVGYVPGVGAKTAGDILLAIEKKSAT
jgi:Holliday junction resolvasome RuvABC DNA-binding subunit